MFPDRSKGEPRTGVIWRKHSQQGKKFDKADLERHYNFLNMYFESEGL